MACSNTIQDHHHWPLTAAQSDSNNNPQITSIQPHHVPSTHTATTTTTTKTPPPKSNFTHLFTFTPPRHAPLLALSLLTSAVVAAGRTAYAVLLGKIFEVVTRFGAGLLAPPAFLAEIARWAVWMCVLGVGMWVVSTVDVAAWVVAGELRAREVRGRVFEVLGRRRRVGWFEGREEGVGGLVVGVQS